MKHNYIPAIAAGLLTMAFACTPIEDRLMLEEISLTANELEITATTNTVDGVNGNAITVENHSKVLSEWTLGEQTSSKAYDVLLARTTGSQTIHFRGKLSGGKYVEKDLTVQVDVISDIPDDIAARLCIGEDGAPDHFGSTFDETLITVSTQGSVVTVCNPNPVLSDWTCGTRTLDKNVGTMKMPRAGEYPLSITVTLADGTQKTVDLGTVTIKDYDLPEVVLNLVGEHGTKTWKFAGEAFYGLGGYMETINQWDLSTVLGTFTSYFGMTGEEKGSMTLDVNGNMTIAPTGREGTFTYDFPDEHGWHIGTISTTTPILAGISFDINTQQPSGMPTEYFVVECTTDKLILGAPCTAGDDLHDWTMCTFWVFKAESGSPTDGLPQVVKNLVGESGTKTWKFAGESFYGLGGYMETINQWDLSTVLGTFTSYFGMSGEESGSMTLDMNGGMKIAPTGREGTFTYDFPDDHGWHIGTISTTTPILAGISFDINTQQPSGMPTEYFVVECTADKLVLGAPCTAGDDLHDWTMCTFWVFKAEAETPVLNLTEQEKALLGETGTKTWKFAEAPFYWLGFYMEDGQYDFSTYVSYFTGAFGMNGEEAGTMTLSVNESISITPTGREGTFYYEFLDSPVWEVGTLTSTIPISCGIGYDSATQQPTYTPKEYIIVECTADRLVLAAPCVEGAALTDWAQCMFWAFVPAE